MSTQLPILVPVEDATDLRAATFAAELASISVGAVRVLSIVPGASFITDRETALGEALLTLTEDFPKVEFDLRVAVHNAVDVAIGESAVSASTLCMTTAATLLPHEGHFGSIAESVVRSLNRPVTLLGPNADKRWRPNGARLVVTLDGSEAGEYVVGSAGALAATIGAEVWVVTVVTPDQERELEAVAGPDSQVLESGYVRRVAKQISEATGNEAQFEVLHNAHPARAILDFAASDGLIAMSTHGRSGLRRIFAGSVTTAVVARSQQPVMVVRPPDHSLSAP